jgi:uncharacterized protein (TIGR03437 family)
MAAAAVAPAALLRNRDFLNGGAVTAVTGIAVDPQGFVYQVGTTAWAEFPTTPGPLSQFRGPRGSGEGQIVGDVFVRKLTPDLNRVIYSVLIGGSGNETSTGIAVDAGGNAYITGRTESSDFPVTQGYTPSRAPAAGSPDAFVTKLDPTGTSLIFSRLIGGQGWDSAQNIAVAQDGRIVVAGTTTSDDFPTTSNAIQTTAINDRWEFLPLTGSAFVTRLTADGSIDYSTYLTGVGGASGTDIAVDNAGDLYVTGFAGPYFPTLADSLAPEAFSGGFVSKIDHATGRLAYSTYLPGVSFGDVGANGTLRIRVDAEGHAYVAGPAGVGFLTTPGAFQTDVNSDPYARYASRDAFLLELDSEGRSLVFSTLFGGERDDLPFGLALTGNSITIAGISSSWYLPVQDYGLSRCNLSSFAYDFGEPYTPFVASFDHEGHLITAFDYGECNNERVSDAVSGPSGLLVAGTYAQYCLSSLTSIDLNATAPVQIAAITDAASFQIGPYSPLEIISIFGKGLGPKEGVAASLVGGAFPTALAGTQVLVGGKRLPLLYVRDDQINAVVPAGVDMPWAEFTVWRGGGLYSEMFKTSMKSATPALFTVDGSGLGQGAILNQDGTVNSSLNPAQRGSIVCLFGTGGGLTQPLFGDGQLTTGMTSFLLSVSVQFGAQFGVIEYAGSAPSLVNGALQVNARIPMDAPTGPAVPVTLHSYPYQSQSGVTVAIR